MAYQVRAVPSNFAEGDKRLIVHGAIMEGVFPFTASMEGESLKAFLIALSRLPGAEETAQKAQKAGDEG